ncbi:MAG: cytochrome c [Rhodospirillales bacterium]|nr:cytochrome c [Rhodospirillales bacterium]
MRKTPRLQLSGFALALLGVGLLVGPAAAQTPDATRRGGYIFDLAGCAGCHTDVKNKGPLAAGGRELKTPFGAFYGPNITPDPQYGLGRWKEADFVRAMRHGIRPDGNRYFPVFPYTSFAKMSDEDLHDLWGYLRSLPPVAKPSRRHDIGFPFRLRFLQIGWQWLNFSTGAFKVDPAKSPEWNRGAYVVQALGHCGECHTPRNIAGATRPSLYLAGTRDGPEGSKVPNITPDPETGIGKWSPGDLADLFKSGMTPDGDFVGATMAEVVRNSTSKMTDADLKAMIAYLRAVPPFRNDIRAVAK